MKPEEIQKTIEGMLSVQLGLQNSQLKLTEAISELRESVTELRESVSELNQVSERHERRIEQLIGYSITGESDRLDIVQRFQNLERRVNRLERDQ